MLMRRSLLSLLVLLAARAAAAPPNILFVLTDDMREDDLEYMPHVRALLADGGVTFESFAVNVSLCCPSRASILRGQYSHNTRVLANTAPGGGYEKAVAMGLERATIATALRDAGYATGFFGKYMNGYPGGADPELVRALEERVLQLRGCAGLECRVLENRAFPEPRSGSKPPKKPPDVVH
jgi:N-acetylglucosamine-6-sulfatase